MTVIEQNQENWKTTPLMWMSLLSMAAVLLVMYSDALSYLVETWDKKEEYSYGYLIPLISLFLLWQKKDELERIRFSGAWSGLWVILFGLLLFVAGELSTLYIIVQYSFLIVLAGIALAYLGWNGFRAVSVPLLILLFMIPLPGFILGQISAQLQLISSELGVWVIELFGISVFLEGNVIDLGSYKLQVVEACNGLRYLFPLMTFGFITAYFYKGEMWKRVLIFISSIPISILMNSFRIGVIGVMVEYWGASMAEGFLHDFEGWVVFMACIGVLTIEMWLLTMVGRDRRSLGEVFDLQLPEGSGNRLSSRTREFPRQYIAASLLLLGVMCALLLTPPPQEIIADRKAFNEFPLQAGEWGGREDQLEQKFIDGLKFEDYILADYFNEHREKINLYIAYYDSQRKGESAHSPRTCIPGGGWEITSLESVAVGDETIDGVPLHVNRTVVELGEHKQLLYYWFQQRGRIVTNEYLVKWYLFWDSLTKNRTDGALVRLGTYVRPGESLEQADRRLKSLLQEITPDLPEYIPG